MMCLKRSLQTLSSRNSTENAWPTPTSLAHWGLCHVLFPPFSGTLLNVRGERFLASPFTSVMPASTWLTTNNDRQRGCRGFLSCLVSVKSNESNAWPASGELRDTELSFTICIKHLFCSAATLFGSACSDQLLRLEQPLGLVFIKPQEEELVPASGDA